MADHGFGKTDVKSSITEDILDKIAEEISKRPYCIRAWRVEHKVGGHNANIHWTFRPIHSLPGWDHEKMAADVKAVVEEKFPPHTVINTDVYIKHKAHPPEEDVQGEDKQ